MNKVVIKKMIISAALAISLCLWGGCVNENSENGTGGTSSGETEIVKAVKGNINDVVSASGIVTPSKDSAIITPQIMGTVDKIYFEENSIVKKGQVLVELDKTDLLKQLEQAEASLSAAWIKVEQAETAVALQPEEIRGQVAQAEAVWNTAEKQVEQLEAALEAQGEQLEAKITQAELALKTAQDNLKQVKSQAPLMEEEADSAIEQAGSSFNTAKSGFERQENLYNQGFISKQDYELAKNQYEIAKTEYDIAIKKGETLKIQSSQALNAAESQEKQAEEILKEAKLALKQQKNTSQKQIGVAQAQAEQSYIAYESAQALSNQLLLSEKEVLAAKEQVKQLEIGIEQIKDQIAKTKVTSPIDGTVIKKQVTLGQNVSPALPVAVVADLDDLVIEALVDEGDIGKVREQQSVTITTDNFPDEKFTGEITMVSSSAADIESIQNVANYKIILKIKDDRGLLKMGMNTYNDIIVAEKKDVLLIPNTAIHQDEGADIVYIPRGSSKEKRTVEIGISDSENIEIISGLSEGEEVISGSI